MQYLAVGARKSADAEAEMPETYFIYFNNRIGSAHKKTERKNNISFITNSQVAVYKNRKALIKKIVKKVEFVAKFEICYN